MWRSRLRIPTKCSIEVWRKSAHTVNYPYTHTQPEKSHKIYLCEPNTLYVTYTHTSPRFATQTHTCTFRSSHSGALKYFVCEFLLLLVVDVVVVVTVAVVVFTCFYLVRFLILRNVKHSVDAFILMRFARVFIIFFFVDIIDCHFFFRTIQISCIYTQQFFFITLCVVLHSEKAKRNKIKVKS